MNVDLSQFRNIDIMHLLGSAGKISVELKLVNIEPLSLLIALNQHHADELARFFSLCGIRPADFYGQVVRCVNSYPRNFGAPQAMGLSEALSNVLQLALQIEQETSMLVSPHASLVAALLLSPGPIKQVAGQLGVSADQIKRAVEKRPVHIHEIPRQPDARPNNPTSSGHARSERSNSADHPNQPERSNPTPRTSDSSDSNIVTDIPEVVGLEAETKRIDEFVEANVRMRQRDHDFKIECDTIITGVTGTGKNYLAEYFVRKLHSRGLIHRPEPVIIDAVRWHVFAEGLGQNLKSISDGVLIIDNAQKLVSEDQENEIGSLDSLFSFMNSDDPRPIVMLLGLPDGINRFMNNNPGVRRLFEYHFALEGYNGEQLADICALTLRKKFGENINVACLTKICNIFKYQLRNRPANWGGAHTAVKMADDILIKLSLRGGSSITPEDISGTEDRDLTVDEVLAKLDDFVGVDNIRDEIRNMVAEIEYDRERFGGQPAIRSHFVFTGNPGTGKTTMARVFAEVLKAIKVLPNGQFVEADRSKLVSGYVGQTAIQTNKLIDSAIGGVLFIDEAYTLVNDAESGSGFGKEAIDTLLKRLEDDRGKFVCIVAGYTKEMHEFLQSNPGMQSRFNKVIEFRDYTAPELTEIFTGIVRKNHFKLDQDAEQNLLNFFNNIYLSRTRNFGNAREARNIFDEAKKRQSRRLTQLRAQGQYRPEMAFTLTRQDIEGDECTRPISLDDVLADMEREFVGMQTVKNAIRTLGTTMAANRRRVEAGIADPKSMGLHILLTGNPGTGKTTVARTLGKALKAIRLLPTDKVIEADKSMMVGRFVGETPGKVNEIVDRAMGGILFVDEAYTLSQDTEGGNTNSYGKEAIETLMKRMEDDRGKFVCILAGYRTLMDEFMRVNPGIESRITNRIHIEDYTADELVRIYRNMAEKQKMRIHADAEPKIVRAIDEMVAAKTKDFGNAREVRKLLDRTLDNQSARVQRMADAATVDHLVTILAEDVPVAVHKDIDERECLSHLDALVGLDGVKREIRNIAQYLKLEKMRAEALGKKFIGMRDHYLFLGNPGTGKTTVARILADIFLSLGISKNTKFVEADRAALVAGYVGQTAPLTNRVIDSALGGILFIDEAYTLNQGQHDNFGHEAIDTLLKRMEDDRGRFVCIAAGYSHEMRQFIASNSGLQSRFNKVITFEDYTENELIEIFRRKIATEGFTLAPGADAAMSTMVRNAMAHATRNFGNAREINNLFQTVKERQSNRIYEIMGSRQPSTAELLTLTASDFAQ